MSAPAGRGDDPDHGLDIDAAFADIVAHFGEPEAPQPASEDEPTATADEPPVAPPATSSGQDSLREMFAPMWQPAPEPPAEDAVDAVDAEEHFVPPEPPPLPKLDPGRKAAWVTLFGTPALALVLLVLQVAIPAWLGFGMGLAFVAGFAYLVATMGDGPEDPWSGDDGAVL